MSSKDKQDVLSKKGCGRVFAYKKAGIVHSYTVECGYYRGMVNEDIPETNVGWANGGRGCTNSDNRNTGKIYTTGNYREIGRGLMITVLDVVGANPYSRVGNSEYRDIEGLRRSVAS